MNSQQRFCEKCGQPLSPDMRFCEGCGLAVDSAEASPPPTPPEKSEVPPPPNPSAGVYQEHLPRRMGGQSWLIAGGAVLVGLVGLGVGYYLYQSRNQPPPIPPATAVPQVPPTVVVPPKPPKPVPPAVTVAPTSPPPSITQEQTGGGRASGWPWTSQRPVTERDLVSLSSQDLRLMLNEIYARHGWVFQRDDLRRYFESQPWYRPKDTLANREAANRSAAAALSPVEKSNAQIISQYINELKANQLAPQQSSQGAAQKDDVIIITNIKDWHHPVKVVFDKNKVTIYKVELTQNNTYPIFYVRLPYDPWFAHNDSYFKPLYYDILKANGFWSYSLVDTSFGCNINIKWDKQTKTLIEDIQKPK
jgi:hypothetical protein